MKQKAKVDPVEDLKDVHAAEAIGNIEVGKEALHINSPGDMELDPTYIPEFIHLADGTKHRVIQTGYEGRWANLGKMNHWRRFGGRFVPYDRIRGAEDCQFEETLEKNIRNGDVYLIEIPHRGLERLRQIRKLKLDAHEGSIANEYHNTLAGLGVESFQKNPGDRRRYASTPTR